VEGSLKTFTMQFVRQKLLKFSTDQSIVEKVREIAGLYLSLSPTR